MRQRMGSILGGSAHDFKRANRVSDRTLTSPFSPRAVSYSLDRPAPLRSAVDTSPHPFYERTSPSSATRPLAWCSSVASSTACRPSRFSRSRSSREYVSVAGTAVSPRSVQGWNCSGALARWDSRHRARVLPLPATSASSAAAADADMEIPYTATSGLTVTVRRIRKLDELRQVATLRADAYYAENQSRFVGSLKKKFVEQEVESLQQRTAILSRQGKPYSECLVAVDPSGAVLACIDMRLPAALNGTHPHGVPQDDPAGCYLLNVVVREDVRGQGLGRGIMRAAMARAVHLWGAGRLYTHVEADNEVAFGLYNSCGFEKHSMDAKYEAASKLGQTVLLRAPAAAAPEL